MALLQARKKIITLKLVYYGCALGGKTTNLITLHRLTDPEGQQGLVSIATSKDRTLFFDLLPMDLGQIGGLTVKVKLYTVPGQIHYELTRRQVLAGADAVVQVNDSSPEAAEWNIWAFANLRENLEKNGLDPDRTPTIHQWNKRDLPDARPIEELRRDVNGRRLPEFEAVATTGQGVVETFACAVKAAIGYTYRKSGRKFGNEQVSRVVDKALEEARGRVPDGARDDAMTFERRFDWDQYHAAQEAEGHDRHVVDQASLLTEAVHNNMALAEKLETLKSSERLLERRGQMMAALSKLAPLLADPEQQALPKGVTSLLLQGAQRKRGSLLLYVPEESAMETREVVPDGPDALNEAKLDGLGSVAHLVCERADTLSVIDDLATEVFFGQPPRSLDDVASLLVAPLQCDGMAFGAFVVYSRVSEPGFDETEREYWNTAAVLVGLSLHWHALRRKVAPAMAS
jgi:signal recognition particle receptor subunit beta